ncbi:MAG TPA: hypothetical protein VFS13_05930 [Steroidobacteraceae bacterium]|nr:hypothetical protein [Steroidobacteraceae bacterium]
MLDSEKAFEQTVTRVPPDEASGSECPSTVILLTTLSLPEFNRAIIVDRH